MSTHQAHRTHHALAFYDYHHPWPTARIQRRLNFSARQRLRYELEQVGRALPGRPASDDVLISRAIWERDCHCGKHLPGSGVFPRCFFEDPVDVGEVLYNANNTGLDGAGILASVSSALEHRPDDTWLVLGIGSGVDVLGVEDGRGTPIAHLFGIDLSDVALRVASALHPQLISGQSIDDIALPPGNRLHVLSSLVFNYASAEVARNWARVIASGRSELVWLNVGYHPASSREQGTRWVAEQELRSLGFSDVRQPIEEAHRCEVSKGGQFVCEAVLWRR